MTTPALTYEQLESRPPSLGALWGWGAVVLVGLGLNLVWADDLPMSFLMGAILLPAIAAAVFSGMAWTHRGSRAAFVVFACSALICLFVSGSNIYTLRELALSV